MDNKTSWKSRNLNIIAITLGIFCSLLFSNLSAADRTVNLIISHKTVNFTGTAVNTAIVANDQLPAPTLHFKQGDHVTLNVYNHLPMNTSVHWHGLLVPWQMDGVEGVSQKPIPPGGVFHYKFTLHQSGTYWYHAHSGVQEQEGLYGAFIIDPLIPPPFHFTKQYPIVLSDWSNLPAHTIFMDLKKDGDYFSPRFPLQPSLMHFLRDYFSGTPRQRKKLVSDYKMMQHMRMSIYDLTDVAYDAFLINGHPKTRPWIKRVKVGDTVRLRFIDAGASTIFHVKIPGTKMQIVQIDGNNVKPYFVRDFTIASGETYDVLVKIRKNKPYIIYAESQDTIGAAYGALITQPHQAIDINHVIPFPIPPPISMGHNNMSGMNHAHHASHSSPTTNGTKYQHLTAAVKTNNPNRPIEKVIRMQLFGWMHSYIWFLNGVPEYNAKPILIKPGKRYRIIFTNQSMMKHPMHIHGHWYILRNGHGAFDPLMHTILVPPGATVVADFDTDASGQWFFHCHHLYHMMAGMAQVFQYTSIIDIAAGKAKPQNYIKATPYKNQIIIRKDEILPLDYAIIQHPSGHPPGLYFASFLDVGEDPFHNIQEATFKGLYGSDYHKLELFSKEAELNKGKIEDLDLDIFYWHPIAQFWAIKGGANYFYRPSKTPYWQPGIGIEGLMPYFIETDVRVYYHRGSVKFDIELSRDTQITNNFFIRLAIRSILATKTIEQAEIGNGLNQMRYTIRPYYRVTTGVNIFAQYEYEQAHGVFKNLQVEEGEPAIENVITFGLSLLF